MKYYIICPLQYCSMPKDLRARRDKMLSASSSASAPQPLNVMESWKGKQTTKVKR